MMKSLNIIEEIFWYYKMSGKLLYKKIIDNPEFLYDIEVSDTNNYYANGICVHNCKGWSSQQGKNLLKLKDYKYKVACTGTLIMNNPLDAYVPLKWIDAENSTVTNFKHQYCIFGGIGGKEIVGFKNLDILKDVIENCSLRRTKDSAGLDLPPKTIINEYVDMSDEQSAFYNAVKNGVKSECDKIQLNGKNLLALTTRLRQATSCPGVLTSQDITSGKIERCVELVEELVSQGEKVVIFSTFKEPVYRLAELLSKYNPVLGTGDMKEEVVSENMDKFQNDDRYKLFIATSSKCGTGFTLNRARYMICIDCPWTSALQQQIEDRIHRVGSTQPVFIYRLICNDTIDVKVQEILETKKALGDFIVDDEFDSETIEILKKYIREL